jgi:hypothetical protein
MRRGFRQARRCGSHIGCARGTRVPLNSIRSWSKPKAEAEQLKERLHDDIGEVGLVERLYVPYSHDVDRAGAVVVDLVGPKGLNIFPGISLSLPEVSRGGPVSYGCSITPSVKPTPRWWRNPEASPPDF